MGIEDSTVVILGASSPQAVALAAVYAGGHALLYLADHPGSDVQERASEINRGAGVAEACEIDLFDAQEVEDYAAEIAAWTSGIDVAVVAIPESRKLEREAALAAVSRHLADKDSSTVIVLRVDD
jgi:NADP-dependent 3-hydroxy acid dehydrogenase YdfG